MAQEVMRLKELMRRGATPVKSVNSFKSVKSVYSDRESVKVKSVYSIYSVKSVYSVRERVLY